MPEVNFVGLESLFLALGDKTRLRLLALMAAEPVTVGFLAEKLGDSQPKVSRHLAYLRNAEVVTTRREGKCIYYGIREPEDPTARGILDTVICSITETATSPKISFSVGTTSEQVSESEFDIYEAAYESFEEETQLIEDESDDEPAEREELDIFLL